MSNSAEYIEFFLNSQADIVSLETLEISHPDFSQVYRFVRNNTSGLTAKIETGATVSYQYVPVAIRQGEMIDNLDFSLEVEVGDTGEILPSELDRLETGLNGFTTKPLLVYRTYRSDDLDNVLFGPLKLEIVSLTANKIGCKIEAVAPRLNLNKTGEFYTIGRFPMLRGFL